MKLHIDTSSREKIIVQLDETIFDSQALVEKSQMLLPFIEKCLKEKNKKLTDITDITVHTGPGSFTGLRVGVSVAQALGWSLSVPVNGEDISQKKFIDIKY